LILQRNFCLYINYNRNHESSNSNFFGLSDATPCQVDLIKFDQIKDELLELDQIVEEVHTLVHDDLLSSNSDEDTDNDFGDDTPTYHERQSASHESSSSAYAPSPKKTRTKFPEGYLADARLAIVRQMANNTSVKKIQIHSGHLNGKKKLIQFSFFVFDRLLADPKFMSKTLLSDEATRHVSGKTREVRVRWYDSGSLLVKVYANCIQYYLQFVFKRSPRFNFEICKHQQGTISSAAIKHHLSAPFSDLF
ncbi:hypothetical protein C0J52_26358, partial [Blattella germanica]